MGSVIILDSEWFPGQRRYVGHPTRYSDLRGRQSDILIIELACGEPPDLSTNGATRGAQEWAAILRGEGRKIYAFLLQCSDNQDAEKRIKARGHGNASLGEMFFHGAYASRSPLVTFPPSASINEFPIDVSTISEEKAFEIIRDSIEAIPSLKR